MTESSETELLGTESHDIFDSTGDNLLIYGLAGNDKIGTQYTGNTIYGGDGVDVIYVINDYPVTSQTTGKNELHGGKGNDRLSAGNGSDTLYGDGGSDTIYGGGFGDSLIYGGNGNDWLYGQMNDGYSMVVNNVLLEVTYDGGDDTIYGGDGNDYILGGQGNNKLYGGDGSDYIVGNNEGNWREPVSAINYMDGGAGNDFLKITGGVQTVIGGTGNDEFIFMQSLMNLTTADATIMDFEVGKDKLIVTSRKTIPDPIADYFAEFDIKDSADGAVLTFSDVSKITLKGVFMDSLSQSDFELHGWTTDPYNKWAANRLVDQSDNDKLSEDKPSDDDLDKGKKEGTSADDMYIDSDDLDDAYYAGDGDDEVHGNGGNDFLQGNRGADKIHGGDGDDRVLGGKDDDYVNGNRGADYINGNLGDDVVLGGKDSDVVHGGKDNDYVNGNLGDDKVYGDKGNDVIHGGKGNDYVNGGNGDDIVYGDKGNDTLLGGAGIDTFVFNAADALSGNDIITDFEAGIDKIQLIGVDAASILNSLTVSGGNTILSFSDTNGVTINGITDLTITDFI